MTEYVVIPSEPPWCVRRRGGETWSFKNSSISCTSSGGTTRQGNDTKSGKKKGKSMKVVFFTNTKTEVNLDPETLWCVYQAEMQGFLEIRIKVKIGKKLI